MGILTNRVIDPATGCWNWSRAKDSNGYGVITLGQKNYRVHRISAMMYLGLGPTDKRHVLHRCDNPSCFNPDHLMLGSHKQNMEDCAQKSRTGNSKKTHCKRGHALSGDNLYNFTSADGKTMRTCRECRKNRLRLHMRKIRHSSLPHDAPI